MVNKKDVPPSMPTVAEYVQSVVDLAQTVADYKSKGLAGTVPDLLKDGKDVLSDAADYQKLLPEIAAASGADQAAALGALGAALTELWTAFA